MNLRCLCLTALIVCVAAPAWAELPKIEDLDEAQQTKLVEDLDQGRKLYEEGRFEDALTSFQRAYRVFAHPDVLYRVAECQERLGEDEAAIASYEMFLRQVPKAKEAMRIRGIINVLQKRLDKRMQAEIAVRTEPEGAQIIVNGKPLGTTPLQVPLTAGTYQVLVQLKGHVSIDETLKVEQGKTLALRYKLVPKDASPVVIAKKKEGPKTPVGPPNPERPADPGFQLPENLTPWIATGAGAVSLLTAGALWMVHSNAASQVDAYDAEKGTRQRPADYNDIVATRNTTGTFAVLFTIGAVGGLTAGAVLWALEGLESEDTGSPGPRTSEGVPTSVTVTPWFAPSGGGGLGVMGRF